MLHNSRNKTVCTVGNSVSLALCSVVEETVDEDRSVRCNTNSSRHIYLHHIVIVNYLHSTSAENVGRTNHYRISDAVGYFKSLVNIYSHSGLRHWDTQLVHHSTEVVTVLSQVDGLRSCAKDVDTVLLEVVCKVKRSLTAELCDNSHRLLLLVDRENVLKCKRLEIELI